MMNSSIGAQTIIRNGAWTSQEEYDGSQQSPIKKEHQEINLSPKGGIIDSLEKSQNNSVNKMIKNNIQENPSENLKQ